MLFLTPHQLFTLSTEPMNTKEQILTRLSELHDQRQTALNEVALVEGVISFWEQQLASLKDDTYMKPGSYYYTDV